MEETSKVLHVRNLAPETEASDLRQYLMQIGGNVSYVVMLSKFSQALVEMEDETQAAAVIQFCQMNTPTIKGQDVVFNFSRSQEIKRSGPDGNVKSGNQEHNGEHVLLLTIINPLYAIDVNVLNSILHPYGNILRIVVFHKNGTQALVEFDNPSSATRARDALDGKDIYDRCCTLRIAFSRVDRLNVRYNNDKTRDFTNPNLPSQPDPQFGGEGMGGNALMQTPYQQPAGMFSNGQGGFPQTPPHLAAAPLGAAATAAVGAVLMCYNLPDDVSCDGVFNLFCLYGNVTKVKLLASKEGVAMVQMFDKAQADQALNHLNNVNLLSKAVAVTFSKHPYIADSRNAVVVDANGDEATSDPNPVCKDYSASPRNRFLRPDTMTYKHIYKPSNVLFFSNVSPNTTDSEIMDFFSSLQVEVPSIKIFANTSSPKKSGLLEYSTVEAAVHAVYIANNQMLDKYTFKVAFSQNNFS